MAERREPRPRDPLQPAEPIGDIATGRTDDEMDGGKGPGMSGPGRAGGSRPMPPARHRTSNLSGSRRWRREKPSIAL
jgi:hypothetical protein